MVFRDLSVKTKLAFNFGILAFLLLAVAAFSLWALSNANAQFSALLHAVRHTVARSRGLSIRPLMHQA